MSYPPSAQKIRAVLEAATGPSTRADFHKVIKDGGPERRAVALLKAHGECFTARDPECPQRVLYWLTAEDRDAWVQAQGLNR